jgi:hypothetical protein
MDFNIAEIVKGNTRSPVPSVSLDARIPLSPNKTRSIKALPDEGEILVTAAARPLHAGVWALGSGVVVHAGVIDRTALKFALTILRQGGFLPTMMVGRISWQFLFQ